MPQTDVVVLFSTLLAFVIGFSVFNWEMVYSSASRFVNFFKVVFFALANFLHIKQKNLLLVLNILQWKAFIKTNNTSIAKFTTLNDNIAKEKNFFNKRPEPLKIVKRKFVVKRFQQEQHGFHVIRSSPWPFLIGVTMPNVLMAFTFRILHADWYASTMVETLDNVSWAKDHFSNTSQMFNIFDIFSVIQSYFYLEFNVVSIFRIIPQIFYMTFAVVAYWPNTWVTTWNKVGEIMDQREDWDSTFTLLAMSAYMFLTIIVTVVQGVLSDIHSGITNGAMGAMMDLGSVEAHFFCSHVYFSMIFLLPWFVGRLIYILLDTIPTTLVMLTGTGLYKIFDIFCLLVWAYAVFRWVKDISIEATFLGKHTKAVQNNIMFGFILFVVSEAMVFFGIFWSYLYYKIAPSASLGGIWPPKGIQLPDPLGIAFANTMILIYSGCIVNISLRAVRAQMRKALLGSLIATIGLGAIFLSLQACEYILLPFCISDSVFGSLFYFTTGAHGMHVLVGVIFLAVCLLKAYWHHLKADHHLSLVAAAIYWHFVDIVWIIVYFIYYVWV